MALSNLLESWDKEDKPESSSLLRRTVGDTAVSVAKGVANTGQAAVGLLDIPTLGYAGKVLDYTGYNPEQTNQFLEELYTPEQQAANREVQNANGFTETLGSAIANPSTIYHGVVESLPLMLGGQAIAKGAMSAIPQLGRLTAGAAGEGIVTAGSQAEQIRQQTGDKLLTPSQAALAAGSGAITGGITALSGGLANKFGAGDADTLFLGGQDGTGSAVSRFLKGGLTEGTEEGLQSTQEQMASNLALDKPTMEGVGSAGAQGALLGFAQGGGSAAFGGFGGRNVQPPSQAALNNDATAPTPIPPPTVQPTVQPTPAPIITGPLTNAVAQAPQLGTQPLSLPNLPADEIITFSDGSQARSSEVLQHLTTTGYTPEQAQDVVSNLLTQSKKDPQATAQAQQQAEQQKREQDLNAYLNVLSGNQGNQRIAEGLKTQFEQTALPKLQEQQQQEALQREAENQARQAELMQRQAQPMITDNDGRIAKFSDAKSAEQHIKQQGLNDSHVAVRVYGDYVIARKDLTPAQRTETLKANGKPQTAQTQNPFLNSLQPEPTNEQSQNKTTQEITAAPTLTPQQKQTRKPIDHENDNLLTAIRKLGGLNKASFDANGGDSKFVKQNGVNQLFRNDGGMSIDDMQRALRDEGFLQDDGNDQQLSNLLHEPDAKERYSNARTNFDSVYADRLSEPEQPPVIGTQEATLAIEKENANKKLDKLSVSQLNELLWRSPYAQKNENGDEFINLRAAVDAAILSYSFLIEKPWGKKFTESHSVKELADAIEKNADLSNPKINFTYSLLREIEDNPKFNSFNISAPEQKKVNLRQRKQDANARTDRTPETGATAKPSPSISPASTAEANAGSVENARDTANQSAKEKESRQPLVSNGTYLTRDVVVNGETVKAEEFNKRKLLERTAFIKEHNLKAQNPTPEKAPEPEKAKTNINTGYDARVAAWDKMSIQELETQLAKDRKEVGRLAEKSRKQMSNGKRLTQYATAEHGAYTLARSADELESYISERKATQTTQQPTSKAQATQGETKQPSTDKAKPEKQKPKSLQDLIRNQDLPAILNHIIAGKSSFSGIAQVLKNKLPSNLKFQVVPELKAVKDKTRDIPAKFNGTTNTILLNEKYLSSKDKDLMEFVLHELAHAETVFALANDSGAFRSELDDIIKKIESHAVNGNLTAKGINFFKVSRLFDKNGKPIAEELIAYGLTDPRFQVALQDIAYNSSKSLWDKFVDSIAKALGIPVNDANGTALAAVLKLSAEVMNAQQAKQSPSVNDDYDNNIRYSKKAGDDRTQDIFSEEWNDLDRAYFDALERGDMEAAQRMVDVALEKSGLMTFNAPDVTAYSIRRSAPPKKTQKVFKAFFMKDGNLYPLYVGAKNSLPIGVWLDAKEGGLKFQGKNGIWYVTGGTGTPAKVSDLTEESQKLLRDSGYSGTTIKLLAYRPGWHTGTLPYNPQGAGAIDNQYKKGANNPEHPYRYVLYPNVVIAEVELAADKSYQQEFEDTSVRKKDGTINTNLSGLRYIPKDGFYNYTTNGGIRELPGDWYIGGSLKINRILSQSEINKIMDDAGVMRQLRVGGDLNLAALGFDTKNRQDFYKLRDVKTYDNNGNIIPLSQRFNANIQDPRYSKTSREERPYTSKQSLNQALRKALDGVFGSGWFNRLMATGKFKVVSNEEADRVINSKSLYSKSFDNIPPELLKFKDDFKWSALKFKNNTDFRNEVLRLMNKKWADKGIDISYELGSEEEENLSRKYATLLHMAQKEPAKKIEKPSDNELYGEYNHPNEVPESVYKWLDANENVITSDATDAVRWWRIRGTHNDSRYPDEPITIYRAVDGDYIREGDWVTTSKEYAEMHLKKYLNGKGRIIEEVVSGRDLLVSPTGNYEEAIYAPLEYSGSIDSIQYSKNGKVQAFYNPKDDTTYFVYDNIDQRTDLVKLMLHEVGVHALQMGKVSKGFETILNQVADLAKNSKNPIIQRAVKAARDAKTKPELMNEEIAGYLVEFHPKLSISQKILAWFRSQLRKLGITKINEKDLVYMASQALRNAPSDLLFDEPTRKSGIRESYAGQKAKNADKSALAKAVEMEQQGIDNETIRKETGWFLGMDDKWRFEINDKKMKIKPFANEMTVDEMFSVKKDKAQVTRFLSDVIDHPQLFEAYPELKTMMVRMNPSLKPNRGASYNPTWNYIEIDTYYKTNGKLDLKMEQSSLLHEIQHAIQSIEGFARGGSPNEFSDAELLNKRDFEYLKNNVEKFFSTKTGKDVQSRIKSFIDSNPDYSQKQIANLVGSMIDNEDYSYEVMPELFDVMSFFSEMARPQSKSAAYERLAGEIESRDTQARMGMTAEERRNTTPYVSQGIPKEDAIVRFGDGVAMSALSEEQRPENDDIRYSVRSTVTDFFTGEETRATTLDDIDTMLNTGRQPRRDTGLQFWKDKLVTTFADATRPFERFISDNLPPELASAILSGSDRALGVKAAFEREAMNLFGRDISSGIREIVKSVKDKPKYKNVSKKELHKTMKDLAGTWLSVRYAPIANQWLMQKDQQRVDDLIAQGAPQKEINKAKADQAKRIKAINDPRIIDVTKQPSDAGLAGGYNNATAQHLKDKIEAEIDVRLLEELADHVYDMNEWKLNQDIKNGKISQATADKFPKSRFYVPLTGDPRTDESIEEVFSVGSGVNQQADYSMGGHKKSLAKNGIDASFEQLEKSARYHGWKDFKDAIETAYTQLINDKLALGKTQKEAETEVWEENQIKRRAEDGFIGENDIVVRKDGKGMIYTINNQAAMEALRSVNNDDLPSILKPIAALTRLQARFVTQLMPLFAPTNMIRDVAERTENIRTRKIQGFNGDMNKVANDAIKIAGRLLMRIKPVMMGVLAENTPMAKLFAVDNTDTDAQQLKQFLALGGSSTYGDYLGNDSKKLSEKLKSTGTISDNVMEAIHLWNNAFEMISGFSIYQSLVKQGLDEKKAATASLNLMNFRKRGKVMTPIRALYMFAQPIATGGHQLAKTLSTIRGAARFAAYTVASAFLYSLLRSGDDDDELGVNKMDEQGNFTLYRNILIPIGDGKYIKVPVGFGMQQLAWSHGVNLVRMAAGSMTPSETAAESLALWTKAAAPIAPAETAVLKHPLTWVTQTFTPQIAKPIVNSALDVNAFGAPLTNAKYEKEDKAQALQGRRDTPAWYKMAAEELAKATGGKVDMYPEQLRELLRGYGAGLGNEMLKWAIENPAKEERGLKTVSPLFDRYIQQSNDDSLKTRLYYRKRDLMNELEIKQSVDEALTPEEQKLVKLNDELKKMEGSARGKLSAARKAERLKQMAKANNLTKQADNIKQRYMDMALTARA